MVRTESVLKGPPISSKFCEDPSCHYLLFSFIIHYSDGQAADHDTGDGTAVEVGHTTVRVDKLEEGTIEAGS